MIRYRYRAADPQGRVTSGVIEAASATAARTALRARGLLPLHLSIGRERVSLDGLLKFGRRTSALPLTDLTLFTRQMATLVSSGVQIEAALGAVAAQSGGRLSAFCQELRQSILDGASLSAALRARQAVPDRYYLTSIEAGERAGRLGAVLDRLADHIETRQRNRQTVTLALIYPAILVLVSLAVIVALLVFVLPDIVRVFASRGAELPRLTQIMIGFSDLLTRHAASVIAAIGAVLGGLLLLARRPASRKALDELLWRLALTRQVTLVQFTGTLATLTQSGVALADALGSATTTVGNTAARQELQRVVGEVRDGTALSRALARRNGFPHMLITMIASGEASGRLPDMLSRFSHDQSVALQAKVKTLVGLVEPLVLLAMGGVVMLLVLAILMPIVNLNTLVE